MTVIPAWPDFSVEESPEQFLVIGNQRIHKVQTDTGRPRTPIFTVMMVTHRSVQGDELRDAARHELQWRYEKAHPNGCPVRR